MTERFDTLLFDVGGVLIRQVATAPTVRERLGMDEASFEAVWQPAIQELGSGTIDEDAFWSRFVHNNQQLASTTDNLLGQTMLDTLEVYTELLGTIAQLGRSGYQLAVLSDTVEPHAAVLRAAHVYDNFGDNVFLSHAIGIRKPNLAAYQYALDRLSINDPSRVLFMDDRERNLLPARQLGMRTLLAPGTEAENRALLLSAINAAAAP